jgi:hypothetical protein
MHMNKTGFRNDIMHSEKNQYEQDFVSSQAYRTLLPDGYCMPALYGGGAPPQPPVCRICAGGGGGG